MKKIVAHRGWSGRAPENTLAAFRLAVEHEDIHAVELDVHLSKDGVPIVIHDFTLERTTSGVGKVGDYTVEELRQLDAGQWFDHQFAGEKIPLLEEVLLLCKGKKRLIVELKQLGHFYEGLEEKVLQLIQRLDMQKEVLVISFNHPSVIRMKEQDASLNIGLVYFGMMSHIAEQVKAANAQYVGMHYGFITAEFLKEMQEVDVEIGAWTVNDQEALAHVNTFGKDFVITSDYPERIVDEAFSVEVGE